MSRYSPIPLTACPWCGKKSSRAWALDPEGDARPKPGDFSMCLSCGNVYVFTSDLGARKPEPDEIPEYAREKIARCQRARKLVLAKYN